MDEYEILRPRCALVSKSNDYVTGARKKAKTTPHSSKGNIIIRMKNKPAEWDCLTILRKNGIFFVQLGFSIPRPVSLLRPIIYTSYIL